MSKGRIWFALGVLFAINMLNFYDRLILGAVGEKVREEWKLADWQLGALGTAFIVLYAAIGVPLGAGPTGAIARAFSPAAWRCGAS